MADTEGEASSSDSEKDVGQKRVYKLLIRRGGHAREANGEEGMGREKMVEKVEQVCVCPIFALL